MNWSDKTVLVTGGSGTLGHALTAHFLNPASKRVPKKIAILSRCEFKQAQMRTHFDNDKRLRWLIGDVRNYDRLWRAFEHVDVVIHAAAMKRIDSCAYNVEEAVLTNVMGSLNVAKAAIDRMVERCMLVSSDKGCQPSLLYGMTKAVAEQVFVNANTYVQAGRPTLLSAVRYGNVLGSRGSVVPIWREQMRAQQAVTVSDFSATRFIITKEQAVEFVLSSIEMMQGGEVFVPNLPTCSLAGLFDAMGCSVHTVTGLQPNEKLHESLVGPNESPVYALADRLQIGGTGEKRADMHDGGISSANAVRLSRAELAALVEAAT